MSRSSVFDDKRAATASPGISSETSNGRFPSNTLNQKHSTHPRTQSSSTPKRSVPFIERLSCAELLPSSVVKDDGVKITSKTPIEAIKLLIYLISMREVAHFGVNNSKICNHIRCLDLHFRCIQNYLHLGKHFYYYF